MRPPPKRTHTITETQRRRPPQAQTDTAQWLNPRPYPANTPGPTHDPPLLSAGRRQLAPPSFASLAQRLPLLEPATGALLPSAASLTFESTNQTLAVLGCASSALGCLLVLCFPPCFAKLCNGVSERVVQSSCQKLLSLNPDFCTPFTSPRQLQVTLTP